MKRLSTYFLVLLALIGLAPRKKKEPTSLHELARRSLAHEEQANVQLILMAVVAAIVLAVSIVIIYSVLGGISYSTIDSGATFNATTGAWVSGPAPATNASAALQSNLATFYQVSPIYLVVLAAVGIISAIMMIVVSRRK